MGLAYSFRCLVHYWHGRKHGSMHTDMVLEKELKVLHPDWQGVGRDSESLAWLKHLRPLSPPAMPHFLKQYQTHSNKASPPNSTSLYESTKPFLFTIPHHPAQKFLSRHIPKGKEDQHWPPRHAQVFMFAFLAWNKTAQVSLNQISKMFPQE